MSRFADTLEELDAGLLVETANEFLKAVVRGVVATGGKGNLTIKLDLERIGDSSSVKVVHDVAFKAPNKYGSSSENKKTATVLHADNLGNLTINKQIEEDLAKYSDNVTKLRK